MKETILKILLDIRPEFDFINSENFIEDGFLDSFDVVTLVSILDETYHISIDGMDVIPDNFSSLEHIEEIVIKNGGSN